MAHTASLGVLLDHAQDKVALLDDDGRFTYVNDAARRILGYEPDALLGNSTFEYIHPDDVEAVRERFVELIDSDDYSAGTINYRFRAADDSWVWLESRMSNLTDDRLDGYVVSSRDVTDRERAQQKCRTLSTRLSELSATTSDVLWLFSGDWSELLFVNPAYESVFGQPTEDIEADPEAFLAAIHPDDRPAVREAMDCLADGQSVEMEYRVDAATEYRNWVWVQSEPIIEDGDVVRIAGFVRGITDRRRRERQLSVMDNLLRHNVRNDIGVIVGNAELIEETVPAAADRAAVIRRTGDDLLKSAEKQRGVIEALRAAGATHPVDLTSIVAASVDAVYDRYPDAEIMLSMPETAPTCGTNELEAAVVELIENAVTHNEATQPSVEVTVSVDDAVTLTVEDDGVTIPSMEASVLTGDHEMDALYHSSGLGFWLIYWVIELSEGSIAVEAREAGGNRIQVSLPKRDA